MKIHEYQGKELFRKYGVATPRGIPCFSVDEAVAAAKNLGGSVWVKQTFDEPFVRMWRLFLNASSVGFKYGSSRLYQILFSNGLNNELPLTRKHIYQDAYH